jgi:nucleoside-diphosphate-sugar epimerase
MEIWRAQQEGLNCVIVNPGVIFGRGFWKNGSGEIFTKIAKGFPFYTKGSTGFVAVEDVVEIMYRLLKSDIKGERFTVIAENIDFNTLSFQIADNLNVRRPFFYAKPFITALYWRIDWVFSHFFFQPRKFSRATAKSLHSKNLYSNKKVTETLNYSFRPIKEYCESISLAFLQNN